MVQPNWQGLTNNADSHQQTNTGQSKQQSSTSAGSDANNLMTRSEGLAAIDMEVTTSNNRILVLLRGLCLIPLSNSPWLPKSFSWREFCQLMYAFGFEPSKQYGTLWHFEHGEGDTTASFLCHEPVNRDPNYKLPPPMAKVIGRRLYRQFKWSLSNMPTCVRDLQNQTAEMSQSPETAGWICILGQ